MMKLKRTQHENSNLLFWRGLEDQVNYNFSAIKSFLENFYKIFHSTEKMCTRKVKLPSFVGHYIFYLKKKKNGEHKNFFTLNRNIIFAVAGEVWSTTSYATEINFWVINHSLQMWIHILQIIVFVYLSLPSSSLSLVLIFSLNLLALAKPWLNLFETN